jgi:hypothetical protein
MMRPFHITALPVLTALMLPVAASFAQVGPGPAAAGEDHRAVLEIGAAAERGLAESSSSVGATIAVETTPIDRWLELELGATALRGAGRSEFSADLLFKKPWQLSSGAEFMAGVGPQLSRRSGTGAATSFSTEFVADFMFWPKKNLGWYLEPSYSVTTWKGGDRSVGVTAGLLIGVP